MKASTQPETRTITAGEEKPFLLIGTARWKTSQIVRALLTRLIQLKQKKTARPTAWLFLERLTAAHETFAL